MDDTMNITAAKYIADVDGNTFGIQATIDGSSVSIPLADDNRDYKEIMRQVSDDGLVIQES